MSDSPFTEQIHQENLQKTSPFANAAKMEEKPTSSLTPPNQPKKKPSVFLILGALFLSVILLIVFMIFVLTVGGPENPVLKTFSIDPVFLKESLITLTNTAFGGIAFILFILLVIGIFRGLMAKKEDSVKKKNSFVFSTFCFAMMFVTIMIWLGVYNFIATFVVNAQAPKSEIGITPSQEKILTLESPVELTLSSEDIKKAWDRKKKKIANFAWDLNNDGAYEFKTQETSFVQEFNESGDTTIRLMVNLADGTQDYYEKIVTLPQAAFSFTPKSGPAPLTVTFQGGRFNDPQNPIIEYAWDFNEDGEFDETGQKAQVEYIFKKIGDYKILLRTKTATGEVKKYESVVHVSGGMSSVDVFQAIIDVSPAASGTMPFAVRFSGENSASPDGKIISYSWKFNDGTFEQEGKKVDHTFTKAGKFNVQLTVKDETGKTATASETIQVGAESTTPKAMIQTNPTTLEGTAPFTVEFKGKAPDNANSNIVSYAWDFTGDDVPDLNGQKVTYVFRDEGAFPVKLIITDADNHTATALTTVKVTAAKLEAKIVATPDSGAVPLTVDFDASSSFSTQGKIASYEWDFGDGSTPQLSGAQKSHRYTRVGIYDVKVKVYTDIGETATASTKVYARVIPTQACYTVSRHDGTAPLDVTFDSGCSLGNIVQWKWDFADSSVSRDRKPVHTFETAGNYKVILEIVDAENNVSRYEDTVIVR